MSDKIILMAGDSWPAGVWYEGKLDLPSEPGLSEHLRGQGFQVRNLAKPGGSNLESVDRVKHYLACNSHEIGHIRFILFFQTEFFREIWYYRKSSIWPSVEKELEKGYSRLKNEWIYRPYHRLTEISQKWAIPIFVLGGASDSVWYDDFETDFPGVKILCQSVTNLLINQNDRIQQPVFCEFMPGWIDEGDFLNLVKQNISNDDLNELLSDIELAEGRINEFKNRPDLFFPDGAHPNRLGHQLLFEFLQKTLPELKK